MTPWVNKHPGGANNIMKWSKNSGTILVYPSLWERNPHGMANWNNNRHMFKLIGRFGDTIGYNDLHNIINNIDNSEDVDDSMGVTNNLENSRNEDNSQVLVCGSPGEVHNSKDKDTLFKQYTEFRDHKFPYGDNRKFVWINIALSATDQLRQRVAWALSQVRKPFHF